MKLLTLARDLRRRKGREHHALFVAEGVRAVEELLRSPIPLRGALVAPQLAQTPRGAALEAELQARGVPVAAVTPAELESAADTETPQGILAIGETPERSLDQLPATGPVRLLVLDGVQDPGNVGTILRTAAAFGATATLALPGTVDLWNAKVVRSAMGALYQHPALPCTWDQLDAFRARAPFAIWGADAAGEPIEASALAAPDRLGIVLGNEGAGLSTEGRTRTERLVSLPIAPAVESLNVAVAAGILLYLLRR